MTPTELLGINKAFLGVWVCPDTSPPEARLETLDTNNGKQEPKEANKEADIQQQGRSLLQTTKNDLCFFVS